MTNHKQDQKTKERIVWFGFFNEGKREFREVVVNEESIKGIWEVKV